MKLFLLKCVPVVVLAVASLPSPSIAGYNGHPQLTLVPYPAYTPVAFFQFLNPIQQSVSLSYQTIQVGPAQIQQQQIQPGPSQSNFSSQDLPPRVKDFESVQTSGTGLDGLTILKQQCASCHTQGSERGSFSLFANDQLIPGVDLATAWLKIKAGQMPPSRPLSQDQRLSIQKFLLTQ